MTKRPLTGDGYYAKAPARAGGDAHLAQAAGSKAAGVRTLSCRTVAKGRFHQLNFIRDLPPQPVADKDGDSLSGEEFAPNACEAVLAAFGSCLAMGIHANAVARNIQVRSLELDVQADINTTAAWGSSDYHPQPVGFEAIRVSVSLDADASRDQLDALIKHATLWSPVANTLHNPVHLDVTLVEGTVP